ncbi:LysR family transcriptional regulator [Pediococcus ethanolidurans]|uniref:LysR family transcriptional regulator n=1 Tax=Pediococcus ethanolidurans TaxID=319653 RepID=UPI001C1E8E74|nr:LysR family transcriptional regulator [Pediococcus ethanolidurans]MBU7555141.1 LysR family transcriptional regulator [Pediococcus ethanolidurans]MBU7563755.1 LysR family transcriptional regulator [Pediococcus ethanolidurans]MCT4398744.1 LysR family transcriptional regulator [Pediococcus ethanolidurans]MCV3315560.1 LysR family transcriptional regulator [Pediococcus ethanolidurans]MCV3321567.1 LysR family transcriptional regulator [Pediococcus ethanolidurans]
MNIKDFEYFQAMVKERNFSRVATAFNVSQPTISTAIKRLETKFQTQLFVRDASQHKLTTTMSGQQLAEHTDIILDQVNVAQNEIRNINTGKIILGLPPVISQSYFPKIAAELSKQNLLTQIVPVEHGSAELLKLLLNGTLDMALVGSVEPFDSARLFSQTFAKTKFHIIVSKKSELAHQGKVWLRDLKNRDFITFGSSFVHAEALKQLSHANHFRPQIIYKSNDPQVIQGMVEKNVGIGFLAESAITNPNVVTLELLDDPQPEFYMSLAYRTNHLLSPVQQKVANICLQIS